MKNITRIALQGKHTREVGLRPGSRSRPLSLITAVALAAASAGSIAHAATSDWILCDLGTLGGSQSWAWSISGNNSTDPNVKSAIIVGGSPTSGTSSVRAFRVGASLEDNVVSSSMSALDVGGYVWGEARGISVSGFNIVGSVKDGNGTISPCYWDGSGDLQTLPYTYSPALGAYSVNSDGYIVGTQWQYDTPGTYQATYWDPTASYTEEPMGTFAGWSDSVASYAFAVSDNDVVVGKSQLEGLGPWTAFRTDNWSVYGAQALEPLQNRSNSEALGVNDSGVAVGDSDGYATLWDTDSPPAAHELSSSTSGQCQANAINNNDIIVGNRVSGVTTVAVVWLDSSSDSTDLLSLNPTIVGGGTWTLINATAINDENWIVGWGLRNGNEHAFLLVHNPQSR